MIPERSVLRIARAATLGLCLLVCGTTVVFAASPVLFPEPLHLRREVGDPLSDTVTIIDEYYHGNRAVSIRDGLTSITDYEKGELIEIDRSRGTYSSSRFDEIARALAIADPPTRAVTGESMLRSESEPPEIRAGGARRVAGREADLFDLRWPGATATRVTIALDRQIALSRDAFDVLTGAAYPGKSSQENKMVAAAARTTPRARAMAVSSSQSNEEYRLPLEQIFAYELDGQTLHLRSTVITVNADLPPPDLLLIPRGAQRVEGAWVQRARILEQIEKH